MRRAAISRRALLAVPALLLAACSDSRTAPPRPARLEAATALQVQGVVGSDVSESPAVRVTSSSGTPLGGVTVSFAAQGGGTVAAATSTSDANGVARVAWRLGTPAGQQTLTASVSGLTPVVFTATAAPGPVATFRGTDTITVIQGATQSLAVTALDAYGNEVPASRLAFAGGDARIATVSAAGQLSAVGLGATTITVSSGSVTASIVVRVYGHPAGTSTQRSSQLPGGPYGIAIAPNDSALGLTLHYNAQLALLTLPAFSMTTTRVGIEPTDVQYSPRGDLVATTNQFSNSLSLVDPRSRSVIGEVTLSGNPYRLRFSPDGQRIYVSGNVGQVDVVDVATRRRTTTIQTAGPANGLALSPDGTHLYVSSMSGGVSDIDLAAGRVARTLPADGMAQEIVVSPDGTELYVAIESRAAVDVVSLTTGTRARTIPMPSGPFGMALSRDGTQLYVGLPSSGGLVVVDRAAATVLRTLLLTGTPRRIAFDRYGGTALVANEAGWMDIVR